MLSKKFMAVCILASTIALFFAAVVLVTSNNSSSVVRNLNWAVSDIYYLGGTSFEFYVNIFVFGADVTSDDDSMTTKKFSECSDSYCNDCASGNKVVLAFVVLYMVFCLPGMYSNIMRAGNGNTATNKTIGTLSASAACICGTISLIVFSSKCLQNIEDDTTYVDWYYGAAYGLLAAGVGLKFVDSLFNSIIDTDAATQGLLDRALM